MKKQLLIVAFLCAIASGFAQVISSDALSSRAVKRSTGFGTTMPSAGMMYSAAPAPIWGGGYSNTFASHSGKSSAIYTPFSNGVPHSVNLQREGENEGDIDWPNTGGNTGEPGEQYSPIGDAWSLLLMAMLFACAKISWRYRRKKETIQ